jgi:MurNAc alpha-1-phosphate uridylyltransferase
MRGMILAAGRGERMGALTAETPKPLLRVAGRYLIEYPILALANIGIKEIVINVSYRGAQIIDTIGGGARYGVTIHYSEEVEALETGGGIFQALPLLGRDPFVVLSSDIITDYPLQHLPKNPEKLAHIVLVDNPIYHQKGDFGISDNLISMHAKPSFTFGNIGVYRPELFANCKPGHFRLGDLLKKSIAEGQISGEHYQGIWHNLGTPEELEKVVRVPDLY